MMFLLPHSSAQPWLPPCQEPCAGAASPNMVTCTVLSTINQTQWRMMASTENAKLLKRHSLHTTMPECAVSILSLGMHTPMQIEANGA